MAKPRVDETNYVLSDLVYGFLNGHLLIRLIRLILKFTEALSWQKQSDLCLITRDPRAREDQVSLARESDGDGRGSCIAPELVFISFSFISVLIVLDCRVSLFKFEALILLTVTVCSTELCCILSEDRWVHGLYGRGISPVDCRARDSHVDIHLFVTVIP